MSGDVENENININDALPPTHVTAYRMFFSIFYFYTFVNTCLY